MWITGTDNDDIQGITQGMAGWFPGRKEYAQDYTVILRFLSNRAMFEKNFEDVSKFIRVRYVIRHDVLENRNSLTRSFHDMFDWLDQTSNNTVGCGFPMTHEDDIVLQEHGTVSVQNVTLTGNAASLFGGIVSNGYLFKDETGPSHGEYAHTLQWLTIAYAKRTGRIKLENPVLTLYKSCAGKGSVTKNRIFTLDPESDKLILSDPNRVPVWSFLVDCFRSSELQGLPEAFGENVFVENYRSPSYLTDQMLYRRLRNTFLGQHIQRRYAKRRITTGMGRRDIFRSTWLEKQQAKKGLIGWKGQTKNVLMPGREPLEALIIDLKTRASTAL